MQVRLRLIVLLHGVAVTGIGLGICAPLMLAGLDFLHWHQTLLMGGPNTLSKAENLWGYFLHHFHDALNDGFVSFLLITLPMCATVFAVLVLQIRFDWVKNQPGRFTLWSAVRISYFVPVIVLVIPVLWPTKQLPSSATELGYFLVLPISVVLGSELLWNILLIRKDFQVTSGWLL